MTAATDPVVLVVEDEPQMRRFLRASLTSHGFRIVEAGTAKEALALATSHSPEVILLDLGLPDGDGIALTRTLREWSSVPIIVLSARGRESDKVEALDAGSDDYLTKPFGVKELLARVKRLVSRGPSTAAPPGPTTYKFGDVEVLFEPREVRKVGSRVKVILSRTRTALVARMFDPAATMDDLAWLRSAWPGPLVVKGIQTVADARAVVDAGADGIVVSNHGGRQLDRAPTPLEVLPPVVDAVGDRAEVYVDGGILSGSDVVAAVALGARAALVGRAYLYGLMAGGERGVQRVADLLVQEAASTLALLGVSRVADLRRDHVRLRPA